jgi:hypothetical protein
MSKKVQISSEADGDAGLPKMKTRSIGLTDEVWSEISELAHGHDSIPGMLRDCLRRGILQVRKERAELKFLEAIAEIKKISLSSGAHKFDRTNTKPSAPPTADDTECKP